MSVPDKERSLEDVLNDYGASEPGPNHASLQEWIRWYPEFRRELTEFTVNWLMMEHVQPPKEAKKMDHDILVLRAMSIVEDRLHRVVVKKQAVKHDLLSEWRRLGLNVHMIATKCDLSSAIIVKLARRFIKFSSIPWEAVRRIAAATGKAENEISYKLQGPMEAVKGLSFSAKTGPRTSQEREDFFEAIRKDRTLDENQRSFWLSLEKR